MRCICEPFYRLSQLLSRIHALLVCVGAFDNDTDTIINLLIYNSSFAAYKYIMNQLFKSVKTNQFLIYFPDVYVSLFNFRCYIYFYINFTVIFMAINMLQNELNTYKIHCHDINEAEQS